LINSEIQKIEKNILQKVFDILNDGDINYAWHKAYVFVQDELRKP